MKISFLLPVVLISACATSPEGRSQLILMPDSQMDEMGVTAFNEMKGKTPIERDPSMNAYVKCVALEVLKESEGYASRKDWEIVVFKDETANAFALPGGKIGVHTGILKVAKSQDQLATVLGHEIGHVIARHGNERVSQSLAVEGALVAGSLSIKDNPNRNLILAGLGLGAQFGVLLPFSRTQESEADIIGLKIMARAGFNPIESVELWKNMDAQGAGHPPEWLSTHPSPGNRIDNLKAHMNEALGLSEYAQRNGRQPNCKQR